MRGQKLDMSLRGGNRRWEISSYVKFKMSVRTVGDREYRLRLNGLDFKYRITNSLRITKQC